MPKNNLKNSMFICRECGFEASKWLGRCTSCGEYNTLEEVPDYAPVKKRSANSSNSRDFSVPIKLNEVEESSTDERMQTGLPELDNVLSGGLVDGSLVLLGGDPGIGKSTLLLQICKHLDFCGHSCLYVSGEESARQVKMRADRLGLGTKSTYIMPETDIGLIMEAITKMRPALVMIDSIQTMACAESASAPGSVVQVRECTARLMKFAKESGTAVIIVGHVTKEGALAGPRILEHMVDTVLYFEGERRERYRLIRAVKNRFGSTNEIAVFEMQEGGLVEINNPSAYMLAGRPHGVSGSAVTCCLEGSRPILAEVQALCSFTQFGNPRRTATGMDYNRVVMLIAVLEKRAGFKLATYDSYVNVAGGMKILEPAADAAVIAAVASSYKNKAVSASAMVFGEVGLTGELRAVTMAERRIAEAHKLGFTECIVPQTHLKGLRAPESMKIYGAASIGEMLELLM